VKYWRGKVYFSFYYYYFFEKLKKKRRRRCSLAKL
jgi:hypothetical protein